jgi:hypothetical protein
MAQLALAQLALAQLALAQLWLMTVEHLWHLFSLHFPVLGVVPSALSAGVVCQC